jgi:hypothetical protein
MEKFNDTVQQATAIILFELQVDTLIAHHTNVKFIINAKNCISFNAEKKVWQILNTKGDILNSNFNFTLTDLFKYLQGFSEPVLINAIKNYEQYSYTIYEHANGLIFWKKIADFLKLLTNKKYEGKKITIKITDTVLKRTYEIGYDYRLDDFVIYKENSHMPEKFFLNGLPGLLKNANANVLKQELNRLYIKLMK